jgi:hypothetical protein
MAFSMDCDTAQLSQQSNALSLRSKMRAAVSIMVVLGAVVGVMALLTMGSTAASSDSTISFNVDCLQDHIRAPEVSMDMARDCVTQVNHRGHIVGRVAAKALVGRPGSGELRKSIGLTRGDLLQQSVASLGLALPMAARAVKMETGTPARIDTTKVSIWEKIKVNQAAQNMIYSFQFVEGDKKNGVDFYLDLMDKVKNAEFEDLADPAYYEKGTKTLIELSGGDKRLDKRAQLILKDSAKVVEKAKARDAEFMVTAALQVGEDVEEWGSFAAR